MKIKEPMFSNGLEYSSFHPQESYFQCEFKEETISIKQSHIKISECTFHKIQFQECQLPTMEGLDVIFEHCDLSNVTFEESALHRVVFKHCRMIGCDFSKTFMRNVTFSHCLLNYANFSFSNAQNIAFEDCDISETSFNESKLKDISLVDCQLKEAEFIHTPLQDIDVSTCNIEEIVVTTDSLKGIIVNPYQAIDLSRLLGLQIKE